MLLHQWVRFGVITCLDCFLVLAWTSLGLAQWEPAPLAPPSLTNQDPAEDIPRLENVIRSHPEDQRATQAFQALIQMATASPRNKAYAEFANVADIDGARYLDETGELILWGKPINTKTTGIMPPLLHLDIFMEALRVHEAREAMGVSIGTMTGRIPTQADIEDMVRRRQLPVEYLPRSIANSYAARVLFEADRLLKTLSHGVDNQDDTPVHCPVPGHLALTELLGNASLPQDGRPQPIGLHWLEPGATRLATEGYTIKFVGYRMRCRYRSVVDDPEVKKAVGRFGEHLSANFDKYARQYVIFRELIRLHKMVQVARWYKEQGYPYDRLKRLYRPLRINTPETTRLLQTPMARTTTYTRFLLGGVDFSPGNEYVSTRVVPAALLQLGAPPRWEAPLEGPATTPARFGSFSGPAPAPTFTVSLLKSRPAPTATSWRVCDQGCELQVVAIPMHSQLPARAPAGTLTAVSRGLATQQTGKQYPDRLQAALRHLRTLADDATKGRDFATGMKALSPQLPTVKWAAANGSGGWLKLQLNTFGTRLDGLRYTSPMRRPTDLRGVMVLPSGVKYRSCVLPFHGQGHPFLRSFVGQDLQVEGLGLPASNQVLLLAIDEGRIGPGREGVVFFTFEQDEPVDVWLTLRLIPAGTVRPAFSAEDVAASVGLPLPLRLTPVGPPAPGSLPPEGLHPAPLKSFPGAPVPRAPVRVRPGPGGVPPPPSSEAIPAPSKNIPAAPGLRPPVRFMPSPPAAPQAPTRPPRPPLPPPARRDPVTPEPTPPALAQACTPAVPNNPPWETDLPWAAPSSSAPAPASDYPGTGLHDPLRLLSDWLSEAVLLKSCVVLWAGVPLLRVSFRLFLVRRR